MNDSQDNPYRPATIARIFVRPLASPLPLGFFAFGIGTVLLSAVEFRWLPVSESVVLAIVLLGFVAPLELVASIMGFLSRDTGSATAMGLFGSGWIVLALSFLMAGLEAKTVTVGIFLVMDALAVLSLAVVSMSAKPLLGILLFLAAARFLLAAIVQFGGATVLNVACGALGLVTGVFAVYGGLALLFEDVKQKSILPVFRRGAATRAFEGNLEEQLQRLQREAGVRQQL